MVVRLRANARQLECYETKNFPSTGRRCGTGRRGVPITPASDCNRAFYFSAPVDKLPSDVGRIRDCCQVPAECETGF